MLECNATFRLLCIICNTLVCNKKPSAQPLSLAIIRSVTPCGNQINDSSESRSRKEATTRNNAFIINEEIAYSRPARRSRAGDPRDGPVALGGEPRVAMMQTADLGNREHATSLWPFNLTWRGRVPIERQVGPGVVVIVEIGMQNPFEEDVAQHDQVLETLTTDRADQSFAIRVPPGRSRRRDHFFNAHALDSRLKVVSINAVAVSDHVPRRFVEREGLDDLLSGPLRRRVRGDVEMNHSPTFMSEDNEAVEYTERSRRNGEKVDGRQVRHMVVQKRPPSLRRRFSGADHVLGNGSLRREIAVA